MAGAAKTCRPLFCDADLIANEDFGRATFPAPSPGGGEHEPRRGIYIQRRDDTRSRRAGDDKEGHGRAFECRGISEVVEAKNIIRSAVWHRVSTCKGCVPVQHAPRRRGDEPKQEQGMNGREHDTYQTRWRPLGIGRTQLTGPLPLGNFRARSGTHPDRALWMLNSSTVPFRRPA